MGYSPRGHKESNRTEHACTFLSIFQGFSTLDQQQSPLGVVKKKKNQLPDQMRIYGGGAGEVFFFLKPPRIGNPWPVLWPAGYLGSGLITSSLSNQERKSGCV